MPESHAPVGQIRRYGKNRASLFDGNLVPVNREPRIGHSDFGGVKDDPRWTLKDER